MAKYNVDYIDKSGDVCHVWTRAHSAREAKTNVMQEYWDIEEIVCVCKAKE